MIVIGYPGIGKTATAESRDNLHRLYLDLESSLFPHDIGSWWVTYCKVALYFSRFGHIVFISSHDQVQEYILRNHREEPVLMLFPGKDCKEEWMERLKNRHIENYTEKNWRAYVRCKEHFDEDIKAACDRFTDYIDGKYSTADTDGELYFCFYKKEDIASNKSLDKIIRPLYKEVYVAKTE